MAQAANATRKPAAQNQPAAQTRPVATATPVAKRRGRPSNGQVKPKLVPYTEKEGSLTSIPGDFDASKHKITRKMFAGDKEARNKLWKEFKALHGDEAGIKSPYPFEKDEAGNKILLEAWPADFDSEKHAPLKAKDFVDEVVFLDHEIERLSAKVKKFSDRRDALQKAGPPEVRKHFSKVIDARTKIMRMIDDAKAAAKAAGMNPDEIDFDSLLANLG